MNARRNKQPRPLRHLAPVTAFAAVLLVVAGLATPATKAADTATMRAPERRLIRNAAITESSGLARSTYRRAILWTHNDSGGGPRLFAVGKRGATRGTVTLAGASALDWEGVTSGRGHQMWVGDVGNNAGRRSVITVYRFTEPKVLGKGMRIASTGFDLRYPDGVHDSEGFMVHPGSGRLYVVTKERNGGAIYAAPSSLSTTRVNVLTRLTSAPPQITGASYAPDGRSFVLGTYGKAWIYQTVGGHGRPIDKPSLRQGESIEFNRSGSAIFMGSEGRRSPIYRVVVGGPT